MPSERATLYVTVGLPGSGKTTLARSLAAEKRAVRLTPDEWMIPLFGEPGVGGKRDVLEGRFVWLAREALRRGINVVLDFGVWSKDERSALKHMASTQGAECHLIYLRIQPAEQWRRVAARSAVSDGITTFAMTGQDLAEFRSRFQEPDEAELQSSTAGPPPEGYTSWEAWIAMRWPTSLPTQAMTGPWPALRPGNRTTGNVGSVMWTITSADRRPSAGRMPPVVGGGGRGSLDIPAHLSTWPTKRAEL